MSHDPTNRRRLRSDGEAEFSEGLTGRERFKTQDKGVNSEGSGASSSEREDEVVREHGSPAGKPVPDQNTMVSESGRGGQDEKSLVPGRDRSGAKHAGSGEGSDNGERDFTDSRLSPGKRVHPEDDRNRGRSLTGSRLNRRDRGSLGSRPNRGTERRRGRNTDGKDIKGTSRPGSDSGSSVELEKTLHLERLVRLEESLMKTQQEVSKTQQEVSDKFDLITNLLLKLQQPPPSLEPGKALSVGGGREGGVARTQDRGPVRPCKEAQEKGSVPSKSYDRPQEEKEEHRVKDRKKARKKGRVRFDDSSSESSEGGSIPLSREKHLEAVRQVPGLANKSNPLKWLLAYKQYAKSRKWSDADYCHMLPLVWDDRQGLVTEEWFGSLSERRKTVPLKLERAFVRKFAQEDTENFVQQAMYSVQGEDEFCEDWFIRVDKQFKQMQRWVPKDVPTEEHFMRVIVTRFSDRTMLQSLNEAQGLDEDTESSEGGARPALTGAVIRRLCKKADRLRRRIEAQSSERHKRRETRESSPGYALVDRVAVQRVEADMDNDLEQVYEYYAESQIENLGGVVSVRSVSAALQKLELPKARQVRREVDMDDFRNVVSRKHEPDYKNQICGFHACKLRGCNMGSRCAHAHEDRVNVKCSFYASPLECPHGIFCRRRHLNEEYGVWFRDRSNPGSFRFAIWKDQKSRFRREPTE